MDHHKNNHLFGDGCFCICARSARELRCFPEFAWTSNIVKAHSYLFGWLRVKLCCFATSPPMDHHKKDFLSWEGLFCICVLSVREVRCFPEFAWTSNIVKAHSYLFGWLRVKLCCFATSPPMDHHKKDFLFQGVFNRDFSLMGSGTAQSRATSFFVQETCGIAPTPL